MIGRVWVVDAETAEGMALRPERREQLCWPGQTDLTHRDMHGTPDAFRENSRPATAQSSPSEYVSIDQLPRFRPRTLDLNRNTRCRPVGDAVLRLP